MNFIQSFDWGFLNFINNFHNPFMDQLMIILTFLGNLGLIWILIAVGLLFLPQYRKVGFMVICALILSSILGDELLKNLIQRPRPFVADPAAQLLITKPLSYSFPSGHTASAFAAAGILAKMVKKYRGYVIALASLIAFSRMYLFVHYPTDIIGGIIVGLFSSKIVLYFFELESQRSSHKDESKGNMGV
ncbi:phosphatase PAP2 family protein [Desulfitobacterium metallireducens]|uniref:PAP2 family phosphoesterase n=1 Tax=Desulfitobacterium metallireducens DSM 15288 TaxID=871968 RepID=W0EA25_9FIRM|nr:phosphatase PAP2 family protein [Desulfitobacterium metallireducens]AHF06084.1 PAP2 family phosphoesterase [Desulfitobacterium metallireducens DSM 15288]